MKRRTFLKLSPSVLLSSALPFEVLCNESKKSERIDSNFRRLNEDDLQNLGISYPTHSIKTPNNTYITLPQKPYVIRRYQEQVYVNFELDNAIYVYDSSGEITNYIVFSMDVGPLKDFAIDFEKQLVYLLERSKHHIVVISFSGEFQSSIGQFGLDLEHDLNGPSSITVDSNGWLHILEGISSKVKVFDTNGSFLFSYNKSRFNKKLRPNQIDGYKKVTLSSIEGEEPHWFFDDTRKILSLYP